MKYFKFKGNVVVSDTEGLASVFVANDKDNEYSCMNIDDSLVDQVKQENSSINFEEINEQEFNTLKQTTWTYSRVQEILLDIKAEKLKEIDTLRDEKINGGISFEGKEFQSAEKDRNLLTSTTALYQIAGATPSEFGWIATDNTIVKMDLAKLIQFSNTMGEHVSTNMYKARQLKDTVLNATTIKEVEDLKVEF